MALTLDERCEFVHREATMTREWIFWGKEEWTPEAYIFRASYKSSIFGRDFSKEEHIQACEQQQYTPLHMMSVGQRAWWWYRDSFYHTNDPIEDPLVIAGLLIQKEQRLRNKEEKARAAARGEAPPKRAKSGSSKAAQSAPKRCPYSILGITPSANLQEIKTAYRQCIIAYHPDKVAALGIELRNLATEMSKKINEAYDTIKKSRHIS